MRLAINARDQLAGTVLVLLAVAGMAWWFAWMARIQLPEMTDLGLVSVVPIWAYLGLVPLATAFTFALAWPACPRWVPPALILVVIATLYGSVPWVEGVIRFSPSWRHLGIVDYVARHGTVNPSLDAYQNWPGIFILGAFVEAALGIQDLSWLALWAPVVFSLAYLPALYLAFRAVVDDRRAIWLAILVFYLGDWIGQDYFSPQAVGFLFYLVMLAIVLRWLVRPDKGVATERPAGRRLNPRVILARLRERRDLPADHMTPASRAIVMAVIIVMFVFVVTTHQLTPFFTIASLGLLVVLGRLPWMSLPVLMSVIVGAWVAFAAVAFLIGHYQNVAGYVGTLAESLAANLTSRIQGSPEHRAMVLLRLGLTGSLWIGALLGGLRRLANGRWDVTAAALVAAPLPLFAVQAYGGEMLLRIALFSLPFTAVFVALAILPRTTETMGAATTATVFGLVTILLVGFVVTRYGNERIESFSRDEIAAVDELYSEAPTGSMLIGVVGNLPWKAVGYESYRYRPNGDDTYFDRLDDMMTAVHEHPGPVYLILTRGQEAYVHTVLDQPSTAWDAFSASIFATGQFAVVYQNPDAVIARYIGPRPSTP